MIKNLIFIFCVLIGNKAVGQISLGQAIHIAQENSFEFKIAQNKLQGSIWQYENFKVSFLPALYLNGNIPNYTRAINKITLSNGEDTFVSQNQSYSVVNLGVTQNVGITGGIFSINSSLNRIDVFGTKRQTRYSSTPLSISYRQETLGFNSFKWQKKIQPLQIKVARRRFVSDMEQIATQTVTYFFSLLSTKARYELSRQNLANVDTLYRITQDRFQLGSIDQSTLLQLKLNSLNARKQFDQDSVDYILSKKQFQKFLRLSDNVDPVVSFDEKVKFFEVPIERALFYGSENSQNVLNFRLQRLQAEQQLAQSKAQNGLKFNIDVNLGITNSAYKLKDILSGVENQQQISLGFSLPILDWGLAKTQKQRAEANLSMVNNEIEQQQILMEQEINLCVSRWKLQERQVNVAKESQEIALKNYNLEMDRFLRGAITINDLNVSQQQKDRTSSAYIDAIREYWNLYFTVRRLTLFDFLEGRSL